MSTAVFPTLSGLGWDVVRTPIWSTQVQTNVSGKESAVGYWSYPRWQWELTYNYLRCGPINGTTYSEFQSLVGFYNARRGRMDSFLYQDADDNAVTGQQIGVGNGSTVFQLARSFGGFAEPIFAPLLVSNIYVNGVNKAGHWTVSNWGSATPGVVTLDAAPAAGQPVTADFSYYFDLPP
jgi:uncharacterized protein (TIGR02217 family)